MRRKNLDALRAIRRRPHRRHYSSPLRRAGAELLELGLVLGLILLPIMFGTIEFGTYFYVEHNLQSAAREGARAGCVSSDITTQNNNAVAAVQATLSSSSLWNWSSFKDNMSVAVNTVADPNHAGQNYCQVIVSITWDKIPAGMRPMRMITNPQNVVLKGVGTMRVEQ
jgi:Flp pilus assembly protein TadG